MTHNRLYLRVFDRPAALERILRVTRHRGFGIRRMSVAPSRTGDRMEISLSVRGSRPLHTLFHQLKKLSDVADISESGPPDADAG
jgi:acetolactate synthase II small subunit